MSRALRHRTGSVVLGALLAGATYWLGIDALLSGALGVALAASVLLLLRIAREFPDRQTGEGWTDGRWAGVAIGVANLGALVGVQAVPLPDGYRPAVGALVILVGLTGYAAGSLAEMERDRVRADGRSSGGPAAGDD